MGNLVWVVCEESLIWAVFTNKRDAYEFRRREFIDRSPEEYHPKIKSMKVYQSLSQAPTTGKDDQLEGALYL